jgi:hypothetical protein
LEDGESSGKLILPVLVYSKCRAGIGGTDTQHGVSSQENVGKDERMAPNDREGLFGPFAFTAPALPCLDCYNLGKNKTLLALAGHEGFCF